MPRWLGLALDPTPGGSNFDTLSDPGPVDIPDPTTWIPVETAQGAKGFTDSDTNNLAYGVRGASAPLPYRAKPTLTFQTDLFSKAAKLLITAGLGKIGTPTGTAPAPIKTPVAPVGSGEQLPALVAWLVRDGQTDRFTGLWVDSMTITVAGAVPTLQVTLNALYQETVATPGSLPTTSYTGYGVDQKYSGVKFKVKQGAEGSEVAINCVANFAVTLNNGLEDDEDVVYCRGDNVVTRLSGGRYRHRQWPGQHAVGDQATTGSLGFGTTRLDIEERQLFADAERVVAEFYENPLGTTPASDRLLRLVIPQQVITGGDGASPLTRTGPIKSSYEWGGFIDPATNADIVAEFVDSTALTLAA
jgi:hypothetical protein